MSRETYKISRVQNRASTKSASRKRCQGRTKGIVPRIRRQVLRTHAPITIKVLSKVTDE